MTQDSIATVKQAYAKFGAGDVEGLLALVSDDIRWEVVGRPADYPTFGVRRGKAEVANFFATLAGHEEITAFEPREFLADGDRVAVFGRAASTLRASGRKTDTEWAHAFTLSGGLITGFREFFDTAQFVGGGS